MPSARRSSTCPTDPATLPNPPPATPQQIAADRAQALSEIEYGRLFERWGLPRPTRQAIRLDHLGRRRYLDVEWTLRGGVKKALEIDGVGHLEPTR